MPTRHITELLVYETADGRCPFLDWLDSLRDLEARALLRKRVNRIRLGSVGDARNVGWGVFELRVHYGPGYRIYCGRDRDRIVLLCGGTKGSQNADIRLARRNWIDYMR